MKPLPSIALIGLGAVFSAASALPSEAITRLRADQTSCADIQGTIARQGAAVLRYPSARPAGPMLFDRYVASRSQCTFGEVLERRNVPAADTPACPVFSCKEPEPRFNIEDD